MEMTTEMVQIATQQVEESRRTLEQLKNDVSALADIVHPQLMDLVGKMRSTRMSVVTEVQATLGSLREIRKFFLESDYQTEVDRAERFIRLCREFQHLKEAGVIDAMSTAAIKLALRDEDHNA